MGPKSRIIDLKLRYDDSNSTTSNVVTRRASRTERLYVTGGVACGASISSVSTSTRRIPDSEYEQHYQLRHIKRDLITHDMNQDVSYLGGGQMHVGQQ